MNGLLCGIESGLQESPGTSTGVSMLEYRAARDQDLGTGTHNVGDGLLTDATVNFNAEGQLAGLPYLRE